MLDFDLMSRRLVLRDHVEDAAIRSLADDAGWSVVGAIARDPEQGIFSEVKWDARDGGSVHYIVDEFADAAYLVAANEESAAADAALARIEARLPVWSVGELLEDCYVHVYPAGWAKSLLRLGVGAPLTADEPVLEHVRFSAGHRDAPVRRAALWAMVYTAWAEFADDIARLAQDDEDPQVADEARRALELLTTLLARRRPPRSPRPG
jgi:hypothetical protein